MTQISGAAALALFIHRQVEAMRSPSRGVERSRTSAQLGNGSRPAGSSSTENKGDISTLVFRRIRLIDPADPQRKRKAFRMFIESVLLFELGEGLINDPAFYQLVDSVQQAMEADAGLAKAVEEASAMLVLMPEA